MYIIALLTDGPIALAIYIMTLLTDGPIELNMYIITLLTDGPIALAIYITRGGTQNRADGSDQLVENSLE